MKIILGDKFEARNCPRAGAIFTVTVIRYFARDQHKKLITVIGEGCALYNVSAGKFRNKKYWRKL